MIFSKPSQYLWLAMATLLLFTGCSNEQVDSFFKKIVQAPPSSIERDVKGHEQIYAVHAILRMGYKGGLIGVGPDGTDSIMAYTTYHIPGGEPTLPPVTQEIDMAKDDDGQMTITTERTCFDVIASDEICYGLELKYYDQNGMLINHQFSGYPFTKDKEGYSIPDEDNATLLVHQHFFGIGNSSLSKNSTTAGGDGTRTLQLAYPRTLSTPQFYYDRYTFRDKSGQGEPATKFSTSNIFAPDGFTPGQNKVVYDTLMAWKAIEISGKPEAVNPWTAPDGHVYRLYKTIDQTHLNEITPEIFTYEYRDTDPV